MKKALIFATAGEVVTGLALLVIPSLVGWLLFGEELAGSCSAGSTCDRHCPDCFRNSLLARSAARRHAGLTGVFLWPAVAFHVVLSILLGRTFLTSQAK